MTRSRARWDPPHGRASVTTPAPPLPRGVSSGGSRVGAAREAEPEQREGEGREAKFRTFAPGARIGTTWLNGAPALRIHAADEFDTAISLTVEGGRITGIYAIRNPHKLGRLEEVAELRR